MTGLQITWLVSILLLILMVWGVPIGVVLCLIPFAGVVAVKGDLAVGATFINTAVFFVTSSATYVVVPMFVLMGLLAGETGITEELFDGMEKWLGWLPGGLAIATSFACAGLAAITGSSLGECVAMAKIAYPEMKKRHYDDALATGVIASAATFALMIPPSIMLAVYAILGDQSIGRCLMAGILPGIITAVAYALLILGRCWLNPRLGPPGQSFPWKARFSSLLTITPFVILILVIVGGILFGVWTPTEAASTAIVVVLVMALARRRLRWKAVVAATRETVVVVGSIFLIIAGSVAYGKFLALTGATDVIIQWLIGLGWGPFGMFVLLVILYLILGCFLTGIAMLALTLPLVLPLVISLGWDPVWFGIIVTLLIEVAQITPPVAVNLYAMKAAAPDIPLQVITRGALQFIPANLAIVFLLYFVPQIALWIPNMMFSR